MPPSSSLQPKMGRLNVLFVCFFVAFAFALPGEPSLECPFKADEMHALMGSPTFEIGDIEDFNDIHDSTLSFELILEDLEDGFLPEMDYNLFVVSYNQFRPINSFLLTVENLDEDCAAGDLFSLTHDVLQVNNCPNFITSSDFDNKVKVGFRWTAPQCGCVAIRASVKHGQSLYNAAQTGEDGALLKTICMDTIDDNDATDSPDLILDLDILGDEEILEDEDISEDVEILEDDSEGENLRTETIQRFSKVDQLCEELSYPKYKNLENILRSCCGISSNIRRRLCFLKTLPHKNHQRKQVKRFCKRLEDGVYGDHPVLATRTGAPFRECCELSGQRRKLSCMKRAKHVQFDSFCERFKSQLERNVSLEIKHWKKCCAMGTTERRRCMSWKNGQSKTDNQCRNLQWKELEGRLNDRQIEMADCCLLDELEDKRQCLKELEWDGYDRICAKQDRLLINVSETDTKNPRRHSCCNETETERYQCFEESVRIKNRRKTQSHSRHQQRQGPFHRKPYNLLHRQLHGPSHRRQYPPRRQFHHQGEGKSRGKGGGEYEDHTGIRTPLEENDMTTYFVNPQNISIEEGGGSQKGEDSSQRFTKRWPKAKMGRTFRSLTQSLQEQATNSETGRQKRNADSTPFIPSLLLSVKKLRHDLLGIAEIHRINTLCKDLKDQSKTERRGRHRIIRCCSLRGEKRIECIMRSAKKHIDAICGGETLQFPFQLGRYGEYVDPENNADLFTSNHECCTFESVERYKCVQKASRHELSKRVAFFEVKPAELFFQPMEPGQRFGGRHGDAVCDHAEEFDLLIRNLEKLKRSVLEFEEEEVEEKYKVKVEEQEEEELEEMTMVENEDGLLSRKKRGIKPKTMGKFASVVRKANLPLTKLYEIYQCCSSTSRRMCLLESWYNSLNKSCGERLAADHPKKSYDRLFEKLYNIDGDVESCCEEVDGRNRQTCFENVFINNDSYSYSYSYSSYIEDDNSYSYSSWFEPTTSEVLLEREEELLQEDAGNEQDNEMHEGDRKRRGIWTAATVFDNNGDVLGSTLLHDDSSSDLNSDEQNFRNLLLLGKAIGGVCNRILHSAGIASFGSYKTASKKAYDYSDEVNSHTTRRDSLIETLKFCCSIDNDFVREMCFENVRAENVDLECSLDEVRRTTHKRARKKLQRCCPLTDSERYGCINEQDTSQNPQKKEGRSRWYTRAIIYKYLKRWLPAPSREEEDRTTDRNDELRESRNKGPIDKSHVVAKTKRKGGSKQSKMSTRRNNRRDSAHTDRLSSNSFDSNDGNTLRRRAGVNTGNHCCRAGYENSPAGLESVERRPICKRHLRAYTSASDSTTISSSCQREFYRCCMAPSNTTERRTNTARG